MILLGVGVIGGALFLITLARPQLLGAWYVRATAWLRIWEKKAIQSKAGYAAIKDKKKELSQKRLTEIYDELAAVRAKRSQLTEQDKNLQKREDELRQTREMILTKAGETQEGSEEYAALSVDLQKIDEHIAKIDAEQEVINQALAELSTEIEDMTPYIEELEDSVAKADMEKELGLMRFDVAEVKKERARRQGLLTGGKESYIDELDREAEAHLAKEIEVGKIAAERTGGGETDLVRKYQKATRAKTAGEKLKAELAKKTAANTAPAAKEPETETLSK
jgi:hypothetical protein